MNVLGVTPDASQSEVKDRYRHLIKRNHPDITGDPGDASRISLIVEAYRVLSMVPRMKRTTDSVAKPTVKEMLTLGRWALEADNPATRAFAVRRLGEIRLTGGIAFLRQAVFDVDDRVADEAVRALFSIPSLQIPRICTELYPGLRSRQQKQMLERASRRRRNFSGLFHLAGDDGDRGTRDFRSNRSTTWTGEN